MLRNGFILTLNVTVSVVGGRGGRVVVGGRGWGGSEQTNKKSKITLWFL